MEQTEYLKLNKPSSDDDTSPADINDISSNFDVLDNSIKKSNEMIETLESSVSNAVKETVNGTSLLIRDVSPLKHSLKIKCSVPTNNTVINQTTISDSEFSFPISLDSFHLHAGVGDSRNSSNSVFVPIVDGVPLTAASVPTNANFEAYITHDIDYSISGTTLTVSGSWSYEQDGTHTTAVNKTVTVVAG